MSGINMNKLEGGVMDIQEKKAFEIAFDNKLGARGCQFDLDEDGNYEDRETLCGWHMWLEAKAQAVPEGFVLVPKEPTLLMQRAGSAEAIKPNLGIVSMRDIYKAMIEAQEPAND